jgi:hypothetical protein
MIRELLALADVQGSARAQLRSRSEAERFRFAIYSFRRQNQFGHNISVTIEGDNTVVLTKREAPEITILEAESA